MIYNINTFKVSIKMDLSKLRAFVVLAEELNFRKSAEILGMSQPPLSRLISTLEEELSTKLFERTTRQVKLTGAGVYLLKEAREILNKLDLLDREVRSMGKLKNGVVSIGYSTASFMASLPKIINDFQECYPKLKLELHQETADKLLKGLSSGDYDLCFIEGEYDKSAYSKYSLNEEVLGALVPIKHILAKRKEIELKELKDEIIILHPRKETKGFIDPIFRLFKHVGIKPKTYLKNQKEICPILVAEGRGVSITISGSQKYASDDTRFIPIKNLFMPVSAYWKPENKNQSLQSFLSFVIETKSIGNKHAHCLMDVM